MNTIKLLKHSSIILCCLINVQIACAQDSILVLQKQIPLKVAFFSVNKIGEIFIVDQQNQLKKLDSNGDSVGVFNEASKYGKLDYVEATNPWKTVLFYRNYSTIVLLDKYLSETASINLRKLNLLPAKIAMAYDNGIWVFDLQDYTLKKIDEAGNILLKTTDLRFVLANSIAVQKMIDKNNFLFLYDPKLGLYQFDHYGAVKNRFAFLSWKDFQIVDNTILGFDDNYLYASKLGSVNLYKSPLPQLVKGFTSVAAVNNKYYFLVKGIIYVYSAGNLKAALQIK